MMSHSAHSSSQPCKLSRFTLKRAARCLLEEGFFFLPAAVPADEIHAVLKRMLPSERADVHWTLGVDVAGLTSLIHTVSDGLLGGGNWAPIGGPEHAASYSRMVRTSEKFSLSFDTTHIDAGVQLEQRDSERPMAIAWHTYPWKTITRRSYAEDLKWAARLGTPHNYARAVVRTLPAHAWSPRLGLTFLTSFTNCSYREGPTILIPGSHVEMARRLENGMWLDETDANSLARDVRASAASTPFEFTARVGDVVVMHPLLVHARNGFLNPVDPVDPTGVQPERVRILAQTAVMLKNRTDLGSLGVPSHAVSSR